MPKPLLPAGCYDILPPFARQDAEIVSQLLSVFETFGYARVSPPLLEYTENMLAGRGASLSSQIFRVTDLSAHKVMGIRPDMTLQIARVAATRMADAPRPLRISYAGNILRMQSKQLKSERQLRQVGLEMIGANTPSADAEVIYVAAEALTRLGILDLTIDLHLPSIVGLLLAPERLNRDEVEEILDAVVHKDIAALQMRDFTHREALIGLIQATGPAKKALEKIRALNLPPMATAQLDDLSAVIALLDDAKHNWTLTVDVTEQSGFSYYSGIAFSFFANRAGSEIGRGGRYRIEQEEGTGFTLYAETLRSILPPTHTPSRVLLAEPPSGATSAELRQEGYVVVHALTPKATIENAKSHGCEYIWKGKLEKVSDR